MKKQDLIKKPAKQNTFEKSIQKRNKLTALAGLGGILTGLGFAWALAPEETKHRLAEKIESAISVAGARELESYLPSFSILFTRYNHIDTSESLKSDILQVRKESSEHVEDFIYQTAQSQCRSISWKTLEDLTDKSSLNKFIEQQNEIGEYQKNWEIKKPGVKVETKNLQKDYIVDEDFVSYIIHVESSGRANAVGSSGERGLMQIMWHTWHDATKRIYGKATSFDKAFKPEENIKAGIAQLEWLERNYLPKNIPGWEAYSEKKKRDSIIAAYNLGASGFIKNYQGNPYHKNLPQTTEDYLSKMDSLVYGKKQVADAVNQWASIIQNAFED